MRLKLNFTIKDKNRFSRKTEIIKKKNDPIMVILAS